MHARDNPRQLYVSNKEGALMRLLRTGVVRMGDEARRRKKMISHWTHFKQQGNCVRTFTHSINVTFSDDLAFEPSRQKNYVAKRFII